MRTHLLLLMKTGSTHCLTGDFKSMMCLLLGGILQVGVRLIAVLKVLITFWPIVRSGFIIFADGFQFSLFYRHFQFNLQKVPALGISLGNTHSIPRIGSWPGIKHLLKMNEWTWSMLLRLYSVVLQVPWTRLLIVDDLSKSKEMFPYSSISIVLMIILLKKEDRRRCSKIARRSLAQRIPDYECKQLVCVKTY